MKLGTLDLLVIGIPLLMILAVAMYMRRYTKSVADFLAVNRCAGRYLICTAAGEAGGSVILTIGMLEIFSQAGFSLRFWESFTSIIAFFFGLLGLVIYRYRETRALTFHQLFEMRYSKGIRIFASFLNVFSGIINFGVQPAVGARFFVYFCGFPDTLTFAGMTVQTFIPVLLALMAVSLMFALSGGQISIMVMDCLEGVISMAFYLVIGFFIIFTLSISQIHHVLLSGAKGTSYIDPFDIGGRPDFNGWYVIGSLVLSIYWYRGNAFNQGFIASAKSAHESRMAGILGNWRVYCSTAMSSLIAIAAFTVLNHPDFARYQAAIERSLQNIDSAQLATQMRMPAALGVFLIPGIKGAFCAVLLFVLLASQGSQLLVFGSTFLQDVVLPLRKTPFGQKAHLRALRLAILGVGMFVCVFSIFFKPVDYLAMTVVLIGSIYLAGIGAATWGGLYWKKGTTAGAWAALIVSVTFGVVFNLSQQSWHILNPFLRARLGSDFFGGYLVAHAEKFPFNGLQLALISVVAAALSYVGVSLLTFRQDFNMDEMLHRGKYRIPGDDVLAQEKQKRKSLLNRFLQIDEHFTRSDKLITIGTFLWTTAWKLLALGIVLWTLFVGHLSNNWWFQYMMITNVWMTLGVSMIVTVWFYIGISRDAADLFKSLHKAKQNKLDDGTVKGHQNAADAGLRDSEATVR